MRLGPTRTLLLLIAILAIGLAWLWVDEQGQLRNLTWTPPKALPPDIKVPISATPANTATSNQFATILVRPLFAPDRKPPPPAHPTVASAPPPPDPLANTHIHGIFTGSNGGILARVDGKMRRIKVNETIGAWTLKSIDARNITFMQGEQTRQLRLDYARLGPPAPPTATSTATQTPISPVLGAVGLPQNVQDEVRDRLRRRNELRSSRGLPPLTE